MESFLMYVAVLVIIVNSSFTFGALVSNSSRFDLIEDDPHSIIGNGSRGNSSLADDGSSWYASFHVSDLWESGNGSSTPFGPADIDESKATLAVPEVPRNSSLHLTNFLLVNESSSSLNPWNTTFHGFSYILRTNETANATTSNHTVPESRSLTNVDSWDWSVDEGFNVSNTMEGGHNSSRAPDGDVNTSILSNVLSWEWNVSATSNSSNPSIVPEAERSGKRLSNLSSVESDVAAETSQLNATEENGTLEEVNDNIVEESNGTVASTGNGTGGGAVSEGNVNPHRLWYLDDVEASNNFVAAFHNDTSSSLSDVIIADNQSEPKSRSLTNVNSFDWNVDLNNTNGSHNLSSVSDGNFNTDGFSNVNSWSWNVVEESNASNSTFDNHRPHHWNLIVLEAFNSSNTALENGTEGGTESDRVRQHWHFDVVEESNSSVATVENNMKETNLSDNFHLFHHLEFDVVEASNGSNAVENEPVTGSGRNQSSHINVGFNATEDNETLPDSSASLFKTNLNVEAESAIANFTEPRSFQNATSANETATSINGTIEDLRADATPDPDSLLSLLNTDPPFAVRFPDFSEDAHEARENESSFNKTTISKPPSIPNPSQSAPLVFKPKPSKETSSIQKHNRNEDLGNQQPGMEVPLFVNPLSEGNSHHQSHGDESDDSEEEHRHLYHHVSEIQQPGMSVPVFKQPNTKRLPALSAYCPTEFSGQPCPEWLTVKNPNCDSDEDCQVEYSESMCCLVRCRRRCVGNVPRSERQYTR